jgi:hypothetical protein
MYTDDSTFSLPYLQNHYYVCITIVKLSKVFFEDMAELDILSRFKNDVNIKFWTIFDEDISP